MSPTYGNARFGSEARRIGRPGNGSRGWPTTGSHDRESFTPGQMRALPSHTRGGSRMPELGPYGSVRGARGNSRPYRDPRPGADMADMATSRSTMQRLPHEAVL